MLQSTYYKFLWQLPTIPYSKPKGIVLWFVEAFSLSEKKIIDLSVKKTLPAVAAILILFATQKN